MPRVADYSIIKKGPIHLVPNPPPGTGEIFFNLDSPHVGSRSILAFNINLLDAKNFRFQVILNVPPSSLLTLFDLTYSGRTFFTVHAVVPKDVFKAQDNQMFFEVVEQPGIAGAIDIADVVLWYQHDV